MKLKLWQRVAALETQLSMGHITSVEFDLNVMAALKQDAEGRKEKTARYHVAINNNTKGDYAYGTTNHYVDTKQEVDELHTEWFEQDNITAVHFLHVDGVEISSAIKTINGGRVVTVFASQDRRHKK